MQRHLRLKHRDDFRRLRREGRVYRHACLMLSVAPNHLMHNRYGMITGKRVGHAVTRNRIRRQLRAVTRLLHPRLHQGHDIVIIAHPAIVEQPFAQIQRIVRQHCEQANLLKDNQS
ncbi:MAG: ribonuclease P protein component [Aggregatilineales bacterium]